MRSTVIGTRSTTEWCECRPGFCYHPELSSKSVFSLIPQQFTIFIHLKVTFNYVLQQQQNSYTYITVAIKTVIPSLGSFFFLIIYKWGGEPTPERPGFITNCKTLQKIQSTGIGDSFQKCSGASAIQVCVSHYYRKLAF